MTNFELIRSGLALVPIPLGRKNPMHIHWNEHINCLTHEDDWVQLEGKNVGIAHAYCVPTPTCAIDIDNYDQAKRWFESHQIDIDHLLDMPDAVVIWSGKKNSKKLLYRLPVNAHVLESKKINGVDNKSALEFRCATKDGKTVQDLLPPSIHPDGHRYQWIGKGSPLLLPQIPNALFDLWNLLIKNGTRVVNRTFFDGIGRYQRQESPRQIATIQAALAHINADCSYETWRNVVWAILSTQWDCAETLAQTWSKSAADRYDEDAFWLLVNSYMPDLETPITVGTIYHHARKGGWND